MTDSAFLERVLAARVAELAEATAALVEHLDSSGSTAFGAGAHDERDLTGYDAAALEPILERVRRALAARAALVDGRFLLVSFDRTGEDGLASFCQWGGGFTDEVCSAAIYSARDAAAFETTGAGFVAIPIQRAIDLTAKPSGRAFTLPADRLERRRFFSETERKDARRSDGSGGRERAPRTSRRRVSR